MVDKPVLPGEPRGWNPKAVEGPKQADGTRTTMYRQPPAKPRATMMDTSASNAVGPAPKRFGNPPQKTPV